MLAFGFHLQAPAFSPLHGLSSQVQMQALKCCSVLAYENTQVSTTLMNGNLNFTFQKSLGGKTCISFKYFNVCLFTSGFNPDVILKRTFKVAVVEIINWHHPDNCD